jgi:hypothetical protein
MGRHPRSGINFGCRRSAFLANNREAGFVRDFSASIKFEVIRESLWNLR